VEAIDTPRRRAGGPGTGVALLHGRRGAEVLLRGIAKGHAGRWYAVPLLWTADLGAFVYDSIRATANTPRSLPRRSLGRPDQDVPHQGRRRRLPDRRGDIRQQPPHRRPTGLVTGQIHLQRRRLGAAPHLRHAPERALGRRLAQLRHTRHRQVHAGHGHWRDKQD
jgi:hypothetical protein